MHVVQVYIDRDNTETFKLWYRPEDEDDFQVIEDDTALRAVFKFGTYCLDTETETEGRISLAENGTVVRVKPGLISGLIEAQYKGWLTVFDALNPEGLAWGNEFICNVRPWSVCPA